MLCGLLSLHGQLVITNHGATSAQNRAYFLHEKCYESKFPCLVGFLGQCLGFRFFCRQGGIMT